MKKYQWVCALLLTSIAMAAVGCGEKNVVQDQQKVGLTAEERKSKRGE